MVFSSVNGELEANLSGSRFLADLSEVVVKAQVVWLLRFGFPIIFLTEVQLAAPHNPIEMRIHHFKWHGKSIFRTGGC